MKTKVLDGQLIKTVDSHINLILLLQITHFHQICALLTLAKRG
jgi:hypothetical protein